MNQARYSAAAITLHWLIAALLVGNIALAWWFNTLQAAAAAAPVALHRSVGITVLLLSLARLALRLAYPPPPLPATLSSWERWASKAVHALFYVVMIGMPLSGWAMVSTGPKLIEHPMTLFGAIPWPAIGPLTQVAACQVKATRRLFEGGHGLLAKLAYGLIALHVGAALKHQFVDRDTVVGRMAPFLGRRGT